MSRPDFSMMEHIAAAVFVMEPDPEGVPRFVFANKSFRNALRLSQEELKGLLIQDIMPPRMAGTILQFQQDALSTGTPRIYENTLPIDGAHKNIRTHIETFTDADTNTRYLVGTSMDFTTERLLRQMQIQLDLIMSTIENATELVADDALLASEHVATVGEMLREDFVDLGDGKLEMIYLLENVAINALGLVGRTLQQAKAIADTAKPQRFCFADLVSEIMVLLDPEHRVEVCCRSHWIEGDRNLLLLVMQTLTKDVLGRINETRQSAKPDLPPLCLNFYVDDIDGCFVEIILRDNSFTFTGEVASAGSGPVPMMINGALEALERIVMSHQGTLSKRTRPNGVGAEYVLTLPGQCLEREAGRQTQTPQTAG